MGADEPFAQAAQRRVEYGTLALGSAAALAAGLARGWTFGGALALGVVLSWLNYRWLKQGVGALAAVATAQGDQVKSRISKIIWLKFLARYALLLLVLYVILTRSEMSGAALLCGLFAPVAAVIVEAVWTLLRGWGRAGSP